MESPALLSSNPITVPKAGDTSAAVFMSVVVSMTHLRATPRHPVLTTGQRSHTRGGVHVGETMHEMNFQNCRKNTKLS